MEERCSKSRRESGGSCVSRDLTCLTRRDSLDRSFYGGGQRERGILWGAYLKLIRHVNSIYKVFVSTDWDYEGRSQFAIASDSVRVDRGFRDQILMVSSWILSHCNSRIGDAHPTVDRYTSRC